MAVNYTETGGTNNSASVGSNILSKAIDDTHKGMSDKNTSKNYSSNKVTKNNEINPNYFDKIYRNHKLYKREDINLYTDTYRFGLFNPYGALSTTREFLFFTKPDLNIVDRDDDTGIVGSALNEGLQDLPYWKELKNHHSNTIKMLQRSYDNSEGDPFNHLLQNQVMSNLEIPGLSSEMVDTPTNMYGVGYSYRGSSEGSDDNPEFSLEFKDTRWLDIYYFFKTYEEYETLKHHGIIRPYKDYIISKVLHDQFAIYKFLVDEDMETIVYFGKMIGVTPKSLPRDVFSSQTFDNGLSYTIDFRAAFYEDMRPEILADFNRISKSYYDALPYRIDIYNDTLRRMDNRAAKAAYVVKAKDNNSPAGFSYKLKWKGDATY